MLLQRLVYVPVLWNSISFACNSIFVLEPSIWIMMGHLIFRKDGAVKSIFLIRENLKNIPLLLSSQCKLGYPLNTQTL